MSLTWFDFLWQCASSISSSSFLICTLSLFFVLSADRQLEPRWSLLRHLWCDRVCQRPPVKLQQAQWLLILPLASLSAKTASMCSTADNCVCIWPDVVCSEFFSSRFAWSFFSRSSILSINTSMRSASLWRTSILFWAWAISFLDDSISPVSSVASLRRTFTSSFGCASWVTGSASFYSLSPTKSRFLLEVQWLSVLPINSAVSFCFNSESCMLPPSCQQSFQDIGLSHEPLKVYCAIWNRIIQATSEFQGTQ
jgi:hypothetical protein